MNRFKKNQIFTYSFLTALYTGMRTGEVFALTWDDINFENKTIKVNKTVYSKNKEENCRWYLGTTKTFGSSRIVYMCDTLYQLLLNYRCIQKHNKQKYKKKYKKYYLEKVKNKYGKVIEYKIIEGNNREKNVGFLFVKEDGTYSGKDCIKYPYKIIHNELKINARFYDLRGSYATTILRNGVEIRDVADVLGHKDIETTENYYISSTEDTRKNVTDSYEKTINLEVIDKIIKYKISI